MALAVDGLSSGLDTTALLNGLMQVEAIPQTLLKRKVSGTQTTINALQQLNSKIASLATLDKETAKPGSLDAFTAKTDSSSVTATASASAQWASLNFTVAKPAQHQGTIHN